MKSSVEQALDMVRNGRITCPICGCGWTVTKQTDQTILAQAIEHHVQEHNRIRAERPSEKDDAKKGSPG